MQPPQRFYHTLNLFNVHDANILDNLLLQTRLTVKEPLDKLAIHEPEWLIGITRHATESTELVEGHLPERVDIFCHCGLEPHKEVLMLRVDDCEEVD